MGVDQFAMNGFADALETIPMALAENSGLSGIESLAAIKTRQIEEKNPWLGVDCKQVNPLNLKPSILNPWLGSTARR